MVHYGSMPAGRISRIQEGLTVTRMLKAVVRIHVPGQLDECDSLTHIADKLTIHILQVSGWSDCIRGQGERATGNIGCHAG